MKRKINLKLLIGFMAPYIVLVAVIFIAQYVSNSIVMEALKENVVNIVQKSFNNNITVIEQDLTKVKDTAAIVAQNKKFELSRIDKNKVGKFLSQAGDIRNELSSYYVDNGVIKDICIQNDVTDCLINFESIYRQRIKYYDTRIHSDTRNSAELLEASEEAIGFSTENICYYDNSVKVIPFVYPIPILKQRTGSVSVYVDEFKLFMPIRTLLKDSGGLLKVTDSAGNLIWSEGDTKLERFINEKAEENYVFSKSGNNSGWSYIICIPQSYVLKDVKVYRLVGSIFNFLIIVVGFLLCLIFSIKKSSSYASLVEALGIKNENASIKKIATSSEFDEIKKHLSKIRNENTALLKKEGYNVVLKVFEERFENSEEIEKELRRCNFEFDSSLCEVVVFRYVAESVEKKKTKSPENMFVSEITRILPNSRLCFTNMQTIAILFECNKEEYRETVLKYVSLFKKEILDKYNLKGALGAGSYSSEFISLSQSYKEALMVAEYNLLTDNDKKHFYDEIPTDDEISFSMEKENLLIKNILNSDFENARKVLSDIYEENFKNKELSVDAINELLDEILNCVKKACKMNAEKTNVPKNKYPVNAFFENLTEFIRNICERTLTNMKSTTRTQRLCGEIKNYIELNYSNPDLTLTTIAENFGIHPNYLSNTFKNYTGVNLIAFLEDVRIEKSKRLLLSGKYTINEIAIRVGYSNDSTFRRRFKNKTGVSPSAYIDG